MSLASMSSVNLIQGSVTRVDSSFKSGVGLFLVFCLRIRLEFQGGLVSSLSVRGKLDSSILCQART